MLKRAVAKKGDDDWARGDSIYHYAVAWGTSQDGVGGGLLSVENVEDSWSENILVVYIFQDDSELGKSVIIFFRGFRFFHRYGGKYAYTYVYSFVYTYMFFFFLVRMCTKSYWNEWVRGWLGNVVPVHFFFVVGYKGCEYIGNIYFLSVGGLHTKK